MKRLRFLIIAGGLLFAYPALAHHGSAGYDMDNLTMRKATVSDIEWTNPHCQIHFDAMDAKGGTETWVVEAPPPSMLAQRNWTKKSLKTGDMVTIYFHAAKNGAPVGIIQKVMFENGEWLRAYPDR